MCAGWVVVENMFRKSVQSLHNSPPQTAFMVKQSTDPFGSVLCAYLVNPGAVVALIGQSQLISQVIKAIVDLCGRQHQYTGTGAGTNDLVHQVK